MRRLEIENHLRPGEFATLAPEVQARVMAYDHYRTETEAAQRREAQLRQEWARKQERVERSRK